MTEPIIKVENLGKKYLIEHQAATKSYSALRDVIAKNVKTGFGLFSKEKKQSSKEEFWALSDISFDINEGEVVGIIGRNGAGKSTLLKVLSRITEPTKGRVTINGRIASLLEVGTGFHPELTGRENIFLNGSILGMTRSEVTRKFDEIVSFAEVEKFLDTPVKRYSSGMYVRLAFAVAAHLEPEILIIDEVLAVGDAEFQKKCIGKMGDVAKGGRTVLFVSHNMAAVQSFCNKVIHLSQGKMLGIGDTDKQIQEYQTSQLNSSKRSVIRNLGKDIEIVEFQCIPGVLSSCEPLKISIKLKASDDVKIEHPFILITNAIDVRVALIDVRSEDGDFRIPAGHTISITASIETFNFVEGEYKVGFHLAYKDVRQAFNDICSFEVMPKKTTSKVVPIEAMWRGFVELKSHNDVKIEL